MKFKVGDWVIHPTYGTGKIESYSTSGAFDSVVVKAGCLWGTRSTTDGTFDRHIPLTYLELWKPEVCEWCWNEDYGLVLVKEVNIVHENDIRIEYLTYNDYITGYEATGVCCLESIEPFIGDLPTFVKD